MKSRKIHSFKNNSNFGDYGPTIVIEHEIEFLKFYTLYGHLSTKSLNQIEIGQQFNRGDKIAELGIPAENGDDYSAPLEAELTTWTNCINAILANDIPTARTQAALVNYKIVEYLFCKRNTFLKV